MDSANLATQTYSTIFFLLGYMAVGKTTIGKILAGKIGARFVDLDHEIETIYHRPVSNIITTEGESVFRQVEHNILTNVIRIAQSEPQHIHVIALGGGTPCFFDNMTTLKTAGRTVWLKADATTIAQRLSSTEWGSRPLAPIHDGVISISHLSQHILKRTPYYSQADIHIDTDHLSPYEITDTLSQKMLL